MSTPPLRLMVHGAMGRMGTAVRALAAADERVLLVAGTDADDDPSAAIRDVDAVIDFSQPSASPALADLCARHAAALVMGTTGHSDRQFAPVRRAAESVPVVFAPNFSVGVNTLFWLTRQAAHLLGRDFDIEVVEMHHRHKVDAPSGTARRLGEILAEARALSYENDTRHGRSGQTGERPPAEIGMHALRGGDVVGDHTVIFAGSGERVELTHRAASRDTFAGGALRAALWARGRPPGLYDMQDVLGLGERD